MRAFVTTLLAAALLAFLPGCDSLLETEPSTAISQETALTNPDAVRALRAQMYDRMHSTNLSTDWLLGPSSLADNTFFRGNQERHQQYNRNLFRAGLGTFSYDNIYNLINDANLLITANTEGGIEDGVVSDAVAAKFQAEGLFMRALAMHHLVRILGYDPNGQGGVVSPQSGDGQGFDLGIVVRTTPTLRTEDASVKARSTVPEVYSQIVSDLNEANTIFSNLPDDVREGSEFFPSQAAVQALLARVRLYQRNWEAADDRAQDAIDLAASSFGSGLASADSSGVKSIFDETNANPEAIFTISVDPATESVGQNNALSSYLTIGFLAQLPTQDLVSLYEEDDARLAGWYDPCFDEFDNQAEDCTGVNDQGFELNKYASERSIARFADNYIHLRIAEMYLIQAEARLNASGVSAAIGRLNDLRAARNASQLDPSNFDVESAYDEILDERRRELVAEGHRFFDLKRLGRDIAKTQGRDDIPFNDVRVLDDLPPGQLEVNTELVQNPGY